MVSCPSSSRFDEFFQPSWAMDHFTYEGEVLRMKLDNISGAGFQSKSQYLFGKVTVQIKLVEGDLAGLYAVVGATVDLGGEPTMSELSLHQSHQLIWVRANYMIYDYYSDTARFQATPVECTTIKCREIQWSHTLTSFDDDISSIVSCISF